MNKRLVWLAPIALAVLLSGCSISVHTAYLAPRDLTRHSVELTNRMRTGPEARFMETYEPLAETLERCGEVGDVRTG